MPFQRFLTQKELEAALEDIVNDLETNENGK